MDATRGNGRREARRECAPSSILTQLGRGTRLGREVAQPGREATALTGRDTPRRRGSSSRRKSPINNRIYAVSSRSTEEDIVMDTNSRRKSRKNTKASSKSQQREDIKSEDNDKIKEVLLWPTFNEDIRLCTESRNYQHLIRLLSLYTQKVRSSVAKPSNVQDDLKNHIKKMLIFFHLYWLDIKQDIADHSRFLNKISVLLNVYIDMELKPYMEKRTSSHVKESSKIATKILAALYIYLNNSEEHIFRVLLKIKQMTEKHNEVWNDIFKERFTKLITKMTSITDKSLDQTCLQPGTSEKTEVIDLTGDDEISTPCKVKRKKTKPNSKCSRVTKNKARSKKPINLSKCSTKLVNADVKECSNKDNCRINPKKDNVTKNQMSNIHEQHPSYMTIGNATSCTQNKGALISQEESAMETIPLLNTCQNNIADQHPFKQELPTSTNCSAMQKSRKRCNTMPVDKRHINHFIIKNMNSINYHSSQITKIIKQQVCQVDECSNCTKIDCKPFIFSDRNMLNDRLHSLESCTFGINSFEIDSNAEINYDSKSFPKIEEADAITKTDYVDNFLDNIQSETLLEDSFWQFSEQPQINYDYLTTKKPLMYTNNDTIVKSQGTLHNIFNADETPYDTNVICMLSDHDKCIYLTNHTDEHIMTTSAEKKMQCPNNSNDICTVSTTFTGDQIVEPLGSQHVSSNIENMMEEQERSNCDTSMLNEHSSELCTFDINSFEVDSKEANEMKTDCANDFEISENISFLHNNSNDICTVSTTFTGDQIVEPLGSQHVSSNIESTMEEQERSNCDTSMLNEHSSELCTFDIDSFEVDSKEANEMKTDCANDFGISENISFLHNIQTETLVHILSNDTTNFLL
ncbi:uncharacterized protein LOC143896532 [Temnothorax americanus]|uniref:uncharacterized protein LOC143896532 n=1 Tax=Temnothorax americanus TaxID=1964332 RepID=UPI0040690980